MKIVLVVVVLVQKGHWAQRMPVCSCAIRSIEANEGKGGGFCDLGGISSRLSRKGCGGVGGVPKSFIGSSLGDLGGDGDLVG